MYLNPRAIHRMSKNADRKGHRTCEYYCSTQHRSTVLTVELGFWNQRALVNPYRVLGSQIVCTLSEIPDGIYVAIQLVKSEIEVFDAYAHAGMCNPINVPGGYIPKL